MSAQGKSPKDDTGHANPAALPTLGKIPTGSVKGKEVESGVSLSKDEDKMMAEIYSREETMDRQALEKAQESLKDIKRSVPEPELKPDVEDAGVYSPDQKAREVVEKGPTIDLPVAEQTYKKGLHVKVVGAVKDKVVVGVSSLAALAMWVGRLLKIAHKHTMRVVFKKGGE